MNWKTLTASGLICISGFSAKADPVAEMAASIVDLREILNARLADVSADVGQVSDAARMMAQAAGQELACRAHDDADVEATAVLAREAILVAFSGQAEAANLAQNFFENQVRYGVQDGCFGAGENDTMSETQVWVSREIGLIFDLLQEIEEREGQLLELLRE